MITEQQKRVCRQPERKEYVRVTILNKQNLEIAYIEGKVIEGSISITNDSYLRRSASLKLILDNELLPNIQGLIWTSNKCKIQIGILDIITDEIAWFNLGVFLFKNTQANYSSVERTLSLTLLDKMANFSGDINGSLLNDIKISNQGVPISSAIKSLVTQIGGENENNILIDTDGFKENGTELTLPYTITAHAGDKILDTLKTLCELYKYRTCYFDTEGVFVAEHTKTLLSDSISEDFKDIDFTINSQVQNDFSYIKNYIKVIGISVEPMVSVEDEQGVNNQNPINNSSGLKIILNKPLYDSNDNRIVNGANLKDYFTYNGTASKYVSATYDSSLWTVTFNIQGENGKILKPASNMIFDSTQIPFDDGGYVYSNTDSKWSRILTATLITDGVNNQTQFRLNFNKALYKNGSAIITGTSLKSSFYYADGSGNSNNFIDAIYTIDNGNYYITLSFNSPIMNATIQINKDGISNSNSLYDNTGLIYRTESYIMDGSSWTMIQNDSSQSTCQIWSELSNTDDTNPYSINNLGEKRSLIINDSNIYTKAQANLRCQFELQTHSNLNEQIVLSTLPLYYLDVNQLIYLYQPDLNINGKYRIDKISFDFKGSAMQITAVKVYM